MYWPNHLIRSTEHRPWPLPASKWGFYQEWNDTLFLHWKVPEAIVKQLLPERLELDVLDGYAWVSLVGFTMQKIRPRYLPAFPPVSEFHELNLRTYVRHQGKAGVYFLSIEAQKSLSVYLCRKLSGMPYVKSDLHRSKNIANATYRSSNRIKGFSLDAHFSTGAVLRSKTLQDEWLTERYCVYLNEGEKLYRFDVHHLPWPLQEVTLNRLNVHYKLSGLDLSEKVPDLIHYAPGVKVLAWNRVAL